MKSTTTGALSGCVVWVIVFGILCACIFPVTALVGGFSSGSDLAMQTLGPLICPEGSTAKSYSYATTSVDDFGNPVPATATELHCVDDKGEVVKTDPVLFAFIWMGILAAVGLIGSALLAFAFAAPAGALIGRLVGKLKKKQE